MTATNVIIEDKTAKAASAENKIQIIVPVYNEGENILNFYSEIISANFKFDLLKFVYDYDGDTTLPYLKQLAEKDSRIVPDKNCFGKGVINALKWGFAHVTNGPVIVIMGDCSDKLDIVPDMVKLWESGAVLVSPSRYMKGGKQFGGGLVKSNMSRVACLSLRLLGFPTADATNNFKLYDGAWLLKQKIESQGGFEVGLELTYKAFEQEKKIVELPTEWRDRTFGKSNFKLLAWTPKYLYWYLRIMGVIFKRIF